MRLSALAVSIVIVSAPASGADPRLAGNMPVVNPNGPTNGKCPATKPHYATKKGGNVLSRKLSELPPAVHYKTAYRRIDGCEVPIIAGYGIGATASNRPRR